ncbi:MAG: replication-relaxation family protein [Chloroflexota bacterium]|nr:replication-relaxation family protein [Chloroflexota bacterium]
MRVLRRLNVMVAGEIRRASDSSRGGALTGSCITEHRVRPLLRREGLQGRILGSAVEPDGVVILQLKTLSAVVCIELDEGTEHQPVIIDKLERYVAQLRDRRGWHLLFVVPGGGRSQTRPQWRRLPRLVDGRSCRARRPDQ